MKRKQAAAMPQPGPEHRRLADFAGTWDFTGDLNPGSYGPGGIVTAVDHNRMLPGGFFLERHYETQSPVGDFEGLEVIGYDPLAAEYFQHGFDNRGETHTYRGTVEGDTWTFLYDLGAEGRMTKGRITLRQLSPTRHTYKMEASPDGKTWTIALDGVLARRTTS